jgi:hypothetical protein
MGPPPSRRGTSPSLLPDALRRGSIVVIDFRRPAPELTSEPIASETGSIFLLCRDFVSMSIYRNIEIEMMSIPRNIEIEMMSIYRNIEIEMMSIYRNIEIEMRIFVHHAGKRCRALSDRAESPRRPRNRSRFKSWSIFLSLKSNGFERNML